MDKISKSDIIKSEVEYIQGLSKLIDKQYDKAMMHLGNSANLGNVDAIYLIGKIYNEGLGIDKDEKIAFECFTYASIHEHALAMVELAKFYEQGKCVTKDLIYGNKLKIRAKELGFEMENQ